MGGLVSVRLSNRNDGEGHAPSQHCCTTRHHPSLPVSASGRSSVLLKATDDGGVNHCEGTVGLTSGHDL